MKVLWFTNIPSLYKKAETGYNGGGWIESLESIVGKQENIELAISFFHKDDIFKTKQGSVTYYPISLYNSLKTKFLHHLFYKKNYKFEIAEYLKVIHDFKPNLIQIFGSEYSFGLLASYTQVPVIIHIQGILNPYRNAWFAPESSKLDYITVNLFNLTKILRDLWTLRLFSLNAKRELLILKNCKFFMGRTNWDRDILMLLSPNSKYYYCSEALRDLFYTSIPWQKKAGNKITISSTISQTSYKGFDLILKTADILKRFTNVEFEWNIFGVNEYDFWIKKLRINSEKVNIKFKGIADALILINNLLDSDLFVHPSYIDNSPNSICEAQILGMPIISTNVGGISSLIDDGKTGLLIPSNDPYQLAAKILELNNNRDLAIKLGANARIEALKRHNKDTITENLLSIYKNVSKE